MPARVMLVGSRRVARTLSPSEIPLPYPEFDEGQFQRWQCRIILPAIDKSAIDRSEIPDIGGGDVEFKIA